LNRPSAIILCRTKEGVDFGSFDGRPARILLASLNRDKAGSFNAKPAITHLLRFLRDDEYREKILGARTQGDIYRLLKEASSFK
jgi:mannitol/fructose-specific phosphotransferase system IIA component (Ntr-type)